MGDIETILEDTVEYAYKGAENGKDLEDLKEQVRVEEGEI